MTRRFLVIYQGGANLLSAYVPDVPGCASIGHSLEELREKMHDELQSYLERMAFQGRAVQEPIMGMHDAPEGSHAEWMIVKRPPETRTVSLNAKIRRKLRMPFRFMWN